MGLADLARGYFGGMSGAAADYGQGAQGLYEGMGNTEAAGTVGAQNAWNEGLGGAGQAALDYWAQKQYQPQPQWDYEQRGAYDTPPPSTFPTRRR